MLLLKRFNGSFIEASYDPGVNTLGHRLFRLPVTDRRSFSVNFTNLNLIMHKLA